MQTEGRNPRPKRKVSAAVIVAVVLAPVILLTAVGSVVLYQLGREDPRDPASPRAWGDRVERRMDAFIDRVRPEWADHLEAHLEAFADRIGWK